jgi:hypothetical protein
MSCRDCPVTDNRKHSLPVLHIVSRVRHYIGAHNSPRDFCLSCSAHQQILCVASKLLMPNGVTLAAPSVKNAGVKHSRHVYSMMPAFKIGSNLGDISAFGLFSFLRTEQLLEPEL